MEPGVLKLWISIFLMESGFLKLHFWKSNLEIYEQIFDKFLGQFSKISNFLEYGFSDNLELELRLKV